jgi:hypothetical protein
MTPKAKFKSESNGTLTIIPLSANSAQTQTGKASQTMFLSSKFLLKDRSLAGLVEPLSYLFLLPVIRVPVRWTGNAIS